MQNGNPNIPVLKCFFLRSMNVYKKFKGWKKTRTRFLDSPLFVTHSPPQFYQDLHDPPAKCQQKPYSSSSYSPFTHQFMKMFMYLPKSYPWLHGCIVAWLHACMYVCMFVGISVCMDVCMHVCSYAFMHIYIVIVGQ